MSRGHGASRRRNYGRRQSEVRHRVDQGMAIDLQGPAAWPRGSGWDLGTESRSAHADATNFPQRSPAAG